MNLVYSIRHYPEFADFSTPQLLQSFHAGLLRILILSHRSAPSELQADVHCKFRLIFGVLPQCSLIIEDLCSKTVVRIVSCAVSA